MSEPIKDGGSAFPSPTERDSEGLIVDYREWGLTKRDYFAAAALTGLLSDARSIASAVGMAEERNTTFTKLTTQSAYEFADAMLAARERKPE